MSTKPRNGGLLPGAEVGMQGAGSAVSDRGEAAESGLDPKRDRLAHHGADAAGAGSAVVCGGGALRGGGSGIPVGLRRAARQAWAERSGVGRGGGGPLGRLPGTQARSGTGEPDHVGRLQRAHARDYELYGSRPADGCSTHQASE